MSIGSGEYLIISCCLNSPYDYNKIAVLVHEMNKNICKINEVTLLDIKPENVSYDIIWDGEYKEIIIENFSIEYLTTNYLSTLEIEFTEDIVARLQLNFLDEITYEVSLIFNYTILIEEEINKNKRISNASFVEDIAFIMFEKLEPIYGHISVEKSSSSLNAILQREEFLPLERAFYRKEFIEYSVDFYNKLVDGKQIVKKISEVGFYFRNNYVDDFCKSSISFEKFDFSEGIKVIERIIK